MEKSELKPFGRPTKLTDALLKKAETYLSKYETLIPHKVGLALFLDVCDATIDNWARENDDFLGIVNRVMQNQHLKLAEGGLSNTYNASITKLLLTKHGHSDRVDSDITSQGQKLEANTWVLQGVKPSE